MREKVFKIKVFFKIEFCYLNTKTKYFLYQLTFFIEQIHTSKLAKGV